MSQIKKKNKNILEIIGFILGFFDQISDIIVIYQNQFVDQDLYWAALGVWLFNLGFVSFVCFSRTITAKYWRPTLDIRSLQANSPYLFARMLEHIVQLIGFVINYVITLLSCIIANIFTIFLVWFGLHKLFSVHKMIKKLLVLLLLDGKEKKDNQENQTQTKIKKENKAQTPKGVSKVTVISDIPQATQLNSQVFDDENQKLGSETLDKKYEEIDEDDRRLIVFEFNIELAEKIFENVPQLTLQIINQTKGGDSSQVINIISIVLGIMNILFNIFSVVKMRSDKVQELYEEALKKIKDYVKNNYFFIICESIQIIYYIILCASYKWIDYVSYKDATYGKDIDDSTRAFIIFFPFCFVIQVIYHKLNEKDYFNHKYIYSCFSCSIKNSFILTYLIDGWSFNSENLNYGQKTLGTAGFIVFTVLLTLSMADRIILVWKDASYIDSDDKFKYEMKFIACQLGMMYFVKSFSQFINNAHYFDFTPYEEKNGDCNENLERVLQGVLILHIFRYFIHAIGVLSGGLISMIFFFIQLIVFILNSMFLHYQINYSYCDDLKYTERHYYTIIFDVLVDVMSISGTIYNFYKYRDEPFCKFLDDIKNFFE